MTWEMAGLLVVAGTLGAFVGMRLSRLLRRRREAGAGSRTTGVPPEGST